MRRRINYEEFTIIELTEEYEESYDEEFDEGLYKRWLQDGS
jgi:hypothetical protein